MFYLFLYNWYDLVLWCCYIYIYIFFKFHYHFDRKILNIDISVPKRGTRQNLYMLVGRPDAPMWAYMIGGPPVCPAVKVGPLAFPKVAWQPTYSVKRFPSFLREMKSCRPGPAVKLRPSSFQQTIVMLSFQIQIICSSFLFGYFNSSLSDNSIAIEVSIPIRSDTSISKLVNIQLGNGA